MPATFQEQLVQHIPWMHGHADVWRAFSDADFFPSVVSALADPFRDQRITKVAGIEARGFILGSAVAVELSAGFVAIRKEGGLFPGEKIARTAPADYRGNAAALLLQRRSLGVGDRVVLVDDWFETGSQALTARAMIEEAGAAFVGASIMVDQLSDDVRTQLGNVRALIAAAALGPSG